MTEPTHVEIGGHRWRFNPIGDRDAFEAECLLFSLLGPSSASAISAAASGFAAQLVKVAREVATTTTEDDAKPFDLARLLALRNADSTDPRIEQLWDSMTEELPRVAGDILAEAAPQLADRVGDHTRVLRLFELHVLGSCFVELDVGEGAMAWRKVDSFAALEPLTRRRPAVKRALLWAALRLHYLGAAG